MFSEGASTPARRRSLSDIESPVLRAAAAAARPLTPRGAPGGAHVFESGENVRVLVRVRPESAREAACTAAGAPPAVAVVGRDDAGGEEVLSRIMVATDGVQHEFSFDRGVGARARTVSAEWMSRGLHRRAWRSVWPRRRAGGAVRCNC